MKERPIIFSGEMVRAIQVGQKTQTRRVVRPQPGPTATLSWNGSKDHWYADGLNVDCKMGPWICPYGQPGDRLWVRETWGYKIRIANPPEPPHQGQILYKADNPLGIGLVPWKSPIHMPKWASRITLEVTGVRVERLKEISGDDARAEGYHTEYGFLRGELALQQLEKFGDPWVWVLDFKKVAP